MKLQARNFVVRKPETIDITMFFKKFCIATRTISLKNRRYRRFFCISDITDAGKNRTIRIIVHRACYDGTIPERQVRFMFITANEVIAGSSTRKRVFSSAALLRRRSARSRRCLRHLMPGTGSADAAIPSSVSIEKSRWLSSTIAGKTVCPFI